MRKLFDASAIMLLSKNRPEEAPQRLKDEYLLDLTLYELGNAVWKIYRLLRKPDRDAALESIEQLHRLAALMVKHEASGMHVYVSIMDNAFLYDLTYYDSAYLTAAQQSGLTLVTEDEQLAEAARRADVPTMNVDALLLTCD
jgi:predicted nucleic acid-binding protein